MGAISDLYRGKISAPAEITTNSEKYTGLNSQAEELYQELKKQLSVDEMNLLEKLIDVNQEMASVTSEDSYIRGFRNGGNDTGAPETLQNHGGDKAACELLQCGILSGAFGGSRHQARYECIRSGA